MSIFLAITLISVCLFALFLGLLVWSIRSGQYDHLDAEGERAIWEDRRL